MLEPGSDGSRRGTACALAAVVLLGAGCGDDNDKLPAACHRGAQTVANALHAAPAAVRLADGTRLSTCLHRARKDADLRIIGTIYTQVADGLAIRVARSDSAALELGYLTGAARRGASRTNGVAIELVRRLEQAVGLDGPPPVRRTAYARGVAAGTRSG